MVLVISAKVFREVRLNIPCLFNALAPQAEWVALNYVPFAERSLEVVVDLYHKTACHKAVINEKVLQNIIKVLSQREGRRAFWKCFPKTIILTNCTKSNKTKSWDVQSHTFCPF